MMADGYRRLGLGGNPFVAEQRPGVIDDLWIDRGLEPPRAGEIVQLVGPRGAGKTSQLLRWRQVAGGTYRHVPPTPGRWAPPPAAGPAFWDEADRIPKPLLVVSARVHSLGRAPLALGTHVDLARWLGSRRAVRTVDLRLITGPDVIRWSQRRIARAAIGVAAISVSPALASRTAASSQGSWRVVGDELHVWAAELAAEALRAGGHLGHAPMAGHGSR